MATAGTGLATRNSEAEDAPDDFRRLIDVPGNAGRTQTVLGVRLTTAEIADRMRRVFLDREVFAAVACADYETSDARIHLDTSLLKRA